MAYRDVTFTRLTGEVLTVKVWVEEVDPEPPRTIRVATVFLSDVPHDLRSHLGAVGVRR